MPGESGVVVELEAFLKSRAAGLTGPREGECLVCFILRMCEEFGCDNTLRWAQRFRDQRAPRATGLEERLAALGGCCDCEVLANGFEPAEALLVRASPYEEPDWPDPFPPCGGVRRGSTQPCAHWSRLDR